MESFCKACHITGILCQYTPHVFLSPSMLEQQSTPKSKCCLNTHANKKSLRQIAASSACEQDGCFFPLITKWDPLFYPARLSASMSPCGRGLRLRKVKWTKETVTRTTRGISSMARIRKISPESTNMVLNRVTLAGTVVSSSDRSNDQTQLQF